ncbi:porin family protein [Psychroflexus salinarum]|uniref:Porin family protein n=1 Tax=Psychroflexus salinarum TaxID=546024 RepID=A0ABW3GP93_9FLAO
MKIIYLSLLLCCFGSMKAQDLSWLKQNESDSLYREDQFYVGFSFNFLTDLPKDVEQSGFSGGLMFGFIRDMPINEKRNISVGLGLGFNLNTFGQTLQIKREMNQDRFLVLNPDIDYDTNRFTTNLIEIPLELRWRTSDIDKLSFWRIYFGIKFGYVISSKSVFRSPEESYEFRSIDGINDFRTSLKLTFGYGAVNFFVDASLTPIFDGQQVEESGEDVSIKPIKVGLVFFFL